MIAHGRMSQAISHPCEALDLFIQGIGAFGQARPQLRVVWRRDEKPADLRERKADSASATDQREPRNDVWQI
jgi:hypothetical protein